MADTKEIKTGDKVSVSDYSKVNNSSISRRNKKNVNNLIYSLLVTLGVVFIIVAMTPRGNYSINTDINVAQVAKDAKDSVEFDIISPKVKASWKANAAKLKNESENINNWYVGYITDSSSFVAFNQASPVNDIWLSQELKNTKAVGSKVFSGVKWKYYDNSKSSKEIGNVEYAYTTQINDVIYLIYGTGSKKDIDYFTNQVSKELNVN